MTELICTGLNKQTPALCQSATMAQVILLCDEKGAKGKMRPVSIAAVLWY